MVRSWRRIRPKTTNGLPSPLVRTLETSQSTSVSLNGPPTGTVWIAAFLAMHRPGPAAYRPQRCAEGGVLVAKGRIRLASKRDASRSPSPKMLTPKRRPRDFCGARANSTKNRLYHSEFKVPRTGRNSRGILRNQPEQEISSISIELAGCAGRLQRTYLGSQIP
jgi:hypothetical protein